MNIPFLDLNRQDELLKDKIYEAMGEVYKSKSFVQGKFVSKFEEEYSKRCNYKYMLGCSSGSTALYVALKALELDNHAEVITTPLTFVASAESIYHVGATPVFVDVEKTSYNIDSEQIKQAITEHTKVILVVHLYGNPANMTEIMKIAKDNDLYVIEDCAHAHLAKHKGKYVGTFGDINAISFNPSKNLGACGDAGAVITRHQHLYEKAKLLIDHGRISKYESESFGFNFRMGDFQANILLAKLNELRKWTTQRQNHARIYDKLFQGNKNVTTPNTIVFNDNVFHIYSILINSRDSILKELNKIGIDVRKHYSVPLHQQKLFEYLDYESLENAEYISKHSLSLPIYPELTLEEINYIANRINEMIV